jgi:hypothetical protein
LYSIRFEEHDGAEGGGEEHEKQERGKKDTKRVYETKAHKNTREAVGCSKKQYKEE